MPAAHGAFRRKSVALSECPGIDNINIFRVPWQDSDVALVVEGEIFHVHRSILLLQSGVFKAMFNGNFKDATHDQIELKDDNSQAMREFLKLVYPSNMLHSPSSKVFINDENIFNILVLADKYASINIIKQCTEETKNLNPKIAMYLLPYAVRHELPHQQILKVIS